MIHRRTLWFCGVFCALVAPFGCSSSEEPTALGDAGPDSPSNAGEAGADDAAGGSNDAPSSDATLDSSFTDAPPMDALPPSDANVADGSMHDADAVDTSVDTGSIDSAGMPDTGLEDAGDAYVCSPGASACTASGSAFCDATGVWRGAATGTCSASCVDATKRFLVSSDGSTVNDTRTGLLWQRSEAATTSTWTMATDFCAAQILAGKAGRLPTMVELRGLLFDAIDDGGTCVPAIDQAAFPATSDGLTWTSDPTDGGEVEVVFFSVGNVKALPTSALASTRCVRTP